MSRERAKGTAFETAVVRYLNEHGFPYAERRAGNGTHDRGDITGIPGWVWELKNHKRIELAEFMREAETEARNAGVTDYCVVQKRKQRPVGDAYAVVPLRILVELLHETEGTG